MNRCLVVFESWTPRDGHNIERLVLTAEPAPKRVRPMRPKSLITTFVEGPAAIVRLHAAGRRAPADHSERFGAATHEAALPRGTDVIVEPKPASTSTSARTEVLFRRSAVPATLSVTLITPRTWRRAQYLRVRHGGRRWASGPCMMAILL